MDTDFLKLAAARYSVRKFRPDPVEPEKLDLILRAGNLAPTACNLQPQRILVLSSEESLDKLRRCTRCHFNCKKYYFLFRKDWGKWHTTLRIKTLA